jgi:hypothetical protein
MPIILAPMRNNFQRKEGSSRLVGRTLNGLQIENRYEGK